MKRRYYIVEIFFIGMLSLLNVNASGLLKFPPAQVSSAYFKEMEYYFDPSNKKIIVYISRADSFLIITGVDTKVTKKDECSVYEFSILAKISDGAKNKDNVKFLRCNDRGQMFDLDGTDFRPDRDKVIYKEISGESREVQYSGGTKEAEARRMKQP